MANISTLIAYRPSHDQVATVSSAPSSVLSPEEIAEILQHHRYSFTSIQRPELRYGVLSEDEVASKAREELERCLEHKVIITDDEQGFYLYRIQNSEHEQTGLICCTDIENFDAGLIKPHEQTRIEKEPIIQKHIRATGMQASPVMLTYESRKDINEYLEKVKFSLPPLYHFSDDYGFTHTVWKITQQQHIKDLAELYENIDVLYIADGHHRVSATAHMKDRDRHLFSILYAHDQLKTLEFNRFVHDLNGMSASELINNLSRDFDVSASIDPVRPKSNLRFGMYLEGSWYSLGFKKPERLVGKNWVEKLNVTILQENLLAPILGIHNPKEDTRIEFINGTWGYQKVMDTVNEKPGSVAFTLAPISVNEMMRIANEKLFMPPKSTWFEPKLRNGLVCYKTN